MNKRLKWSKEAKKLLENMAFNQTEIEEVELWIEENMFVVGTGHILEYINNK